MTNELGIKLIALNYSASGRESTYLKVVVSSLRILIELGLKSEENVSTLM